MEDPVKLKQAFLPSAIGLALAVNFVGCKTDDTAVKALQELTSQLSKQVDAQNQELVGLAAGLQTCMKDLATTKGEAVVVSSTEVEVETPSLEGDVNVGSLEALKAALNQTMEEQKALLAELKTKSEQCTKDLEAAKAEAEAAAAAEAAARDAAAKKKAAAQQKAATQEKATAKRKAKGQKWGN